MAPRRRRTSIRWDRVGSAALLLVLGVILLLYISPVRHWLAQSATADHQRTELRQLEREHQQLQARIDGLRGQDAIEREARRLGMVRAGERAIVIENLPGD
jgi:cell division protein FtsB